MKDYKGKFEVEGKEYELIFNLNVMQEIQEEYGSVEAWGNLTDAKNGEVNAKALIFGLTSMINEAIDIKNEENSTNEPMLTCKQVGRLVTKAGINNSAEQLNKTITDSTKTNEKN